MRSLETLLKQVELDTSSSIRISVSARDSLLLGFPKAKTPTIKIIPDYISCAGANGDHAHGDFTSVSSLSLLY
jgi:hypothetical protein